MSRSARGPRIGRLPPARRKRPPRAPVLKPTSRRPLRPPLRIYSILAWADEHHARTGRWPSAGSGEVKAAPWETWSGIDRAFRDGLRGCRSGGSLRILLHKHRGQPLTPGRSGAPLTLRQILAWADAYHRRTKRWPSNGDGVVGAGQSDTWRAVDHALRRGMRALPGGDSLARLLYRARGVRRGRMQPPLTILEVLAWADAHQARTGRWPSTSSGKVRGAAGEKWSAIDGALTRGTRTLPRGYTLASLLVKFRGHRNRMAAPPLTEAKILAWADAHHRRTGRWPTNRTEAIPEAPGENWSMVERALREGQRGLPGGTTISRLLMKHGRRPYKAPPKRPAVPRPALTIARILAWADEYQRRNGRWPTLTSGLIAGTRDETWQSVDNALHVGVRGLPGGSSVALLLERERGRVHKQHQGRLLSRDILAWADAHHARTGSWPTGKSGRIPESPAGVTWSAVDGVLSQGLRGWPGGDTLKRFLERNGRLPTKAPLSIPQVLAWADQFRLRPGRRPSACCGRLGPARGENWCALDLALRKGSGGLPGGSSLSLLLELHRGVPHPQHRPQFTVPDILRWADAFYSRTGRWPYITAGAIPESPGDTWQMVQAALWQGSRGLPGGDTLTRLLQRHQRVPKIAPLTVAGILEWADKFHRRQGRWPTARAGPVDGVDGVTWAAVDNALRSGHHGLSGGSSLPQLLEQQRGVAHWLHRPRMTPEEILRWADAYHEREGRWPIAGAEPIPEATGETWNVVDNALRNGVRGLPGGDSLFRLLKRERRITGDEPARARARRTPSGPPLPIESILAWADAHRQRTGRWPPSDGRAVREAPGEQWRKIDYALRHGGRGLGGGSSLPRLLHEHRGKPLRSPLPRPNLTVKQILAWADEFHRRSGRWPSLQTPGPVAQGCDDTWLAVDHALRRGSRGLPGGDSLPRMLGRYRRVRRAALRPRLTIAQILAWADAHHARHGRWPSAGSGQIPGAPGERWGSINVALANASRGLPPGYTLASLLATCRGLRHKGALPRYTVTGILAWAAAHRARTGHWPGIHAGPIPESPGDAWVNVDSALRQGCRGLPGGDNLLRFLVRHGRVPADDWRVRRNRAVAASRRSARGRKATASGG